MANAHSSINYIEPNLSASGLYKVTNESGGTSWKVDDNYERAPRLEDYSIYFNIEVEVCSRENISANKKITSDVLILSYRQNLNTSAETVNFMGGTKVKTSNEGYNPMQYLTTNYADMYVGDLYDYGTTEMIGVKSVDIEYQASCVPVVTVKFTDVRGISLFQPTELSRTNSYQGIGGINADNVAQSFFQCFFRVPMPRFTMTIKGFYGKPVTYECLCDKFDTKFNSNTGDFDITTRFIGYSYSFLTDISIDALFAAPYSDFGGGRVGNYNKYWAEKTQSEDFYIYNKEKTEKQTMPTLFEIWQNLQSIFSKPNADMSGIEVESFSHMGEIEELKTILSLYETWYKTLFNICVDRYGKDYCFLFKKSNKDEDFYRILILTKESNNKSFGLEYEQFPDNFKEINRNLYATIAKYNENDNNFKKLENVSLDFAENYPLLLFRPTYLNPKGRVIFDGFYDGNKIPETQVVNNVFYGVNYADDSTNIEEIRTKEANHKRHILETIYDDGTDQYIKCYSIDRDYSSIKQRIEYLQAEANKSDEDRNIEARRKVINKKLIEQMGWFPSIENFTRIMMAHFETLMKQMYDVATQCEGRTASELGVTTGPDGTCIDVNAAKDVIPPFPRVTKRILGEDNITKIEDTWVGEYSHGEKPFVEVDFIDGLLNGIEKIRAIKKDSEVNIAEEKRQVESTSSAYGGVIKHPLSTFDFYITGTPYGNSDELSNDPKGYDFMGKVCMRMFNILCLGNMLKYNDSTLRDIGTVEAVNFHEQVKITNPTFQTLIRNGELSGEKIIEEVKKKSKDHPWGDTELFTFSGNTLWLDGYKIEKDKGNENWIYPIQNIDYGRLDEITKAFIQGVSNGGNDISIYTIPNNFKLNDYNSDSAYGNAIIMEGDDITKLEETISNANSDCDEAYTNLYAAISAETEFKESEYRKWFKSYSSGISPNPIPSISLCRTQGEKITSNDVNIPSNGGFISVKGVKYTANDDEFESVIGLTKDGDTSKFTITEVFGLNKDGEMVVESSFAESSNTSRYVGDIDFLGKKIEKKHILAILGVKTNNGNFSEREFNTSTFTYIPKIVLLQLGALCVSVGSLSLRTNKYENYLKKISLRLGFGETTLKALHSKKIEIISKLSKQVRLLFANYFINWCEKQSAHNFVSTILNVLNYFKKDGKRCLLDENKQDVKKVVQDLLSVKLYVRLSVNAIDGRSRRDYALSEGYAKIYLDAFMEKLKQYYQIDYKEDTDGNVIRTVDEPRHTNDDIKVELYRYMKQVYDKWIPMSSFDEWTLETFFNRNQGEERGHTFYFIDSYYNDIGHKLLINPKNLMEKIDALLNYSDVNAMMLGFMADIYASNRCMMKCIQNFFDLTSQGSMTEMFMPMPFNSINWSKEVNKYPSFVVIYPYEPSRNLNVPNNEYNDDGFMLNDENETPQAIRSKTDDKRHYRIPAFGVAYGKQYQSYFKSVNINMQSPVATQQSIQAKHYILQQAAETRSPGIIGQDLYDVYSTQSYTCDVEMMGCAWVQPMMYFVLLNVPMFRGSYLIMKVRHSIKPGDMTTTFTGCRMANVSNKLVEDIFTDDFIESNNNGGDGSVSNRELKANIDNDCPYKIFPLYGADGAGADLSSELSRKVQRSDCYSDYEYNLLKNDTILYALSRIAANEGGQVSQKLELQEMLIATTMYNRRVHSGNYKQSIFKHLQYDIKRAANTTPKDWVVDIVKNVFTYSPSWILTKYNTTTVNNNNLKSYSDSKNFKKGSKIVATKFTLDDLRRIVFFGNYNEYAAYKNSWVLKQPVMMAQDANLDGSLGHCFNSDENQTFMWDVQKKDNKMQEKENINEALFNAIKKSAQETPSIGIELVKNVVKNKTTNKTYYTITQKDGGNDKLPLVFDMILNSEYFYCIQELYWIYPSGGISVNPIHIDYIAAENPDAKNKFVRVAETEVINTSEVKGIPSDANEKLLRALAKYRAKKGDKYLQKDVPQMTDLSILDKYKPENCDSLFSSGGEVGSKSLVNVNVTDVSCNVSGGKIGDWNVAASANFLISHARDSWAQKTCKPNNIIVNGRCTGVCWGYVKRALQAGGFPLDGSESAYQAKFFLEKQGFKCIKKGFCNGHKGTEYNNVCMGDITVFEPYRDNRGYQKHGHINMWCGQQWISDFKQDGNWVSSSAKGEFSVWRYTGNGMKKS